MPATPVCDLLREEHRTIDDCLDALLDSARKLRSARVAGLRTPLDRLRNLLGIHFEREERILFPPLRRQYPALVARMRDQHEYLRFLEREITGMLDGIPAKPARAWVEELRSWVVEFCERLRSHSNDEEEQLLRVAAACLRSGDQARMARRMAALKSVPAR